MAGLGVEAGAERTEGRRTGVGEGRERDVPPFGVVAGGRFGAGLRSVALGRTGAVRAGTGQTLSKLAGGGRMPVLPSPQAQPSTEPGATW